MNESLDEEYLTWLYSQVGNPILKNPRRTYWSLFRKLYLKEFIWRVPNDDNRVEDGRDLRFEFLEEVDVPADEEWAEDPGCSFLEMTIAISRRLAFEADGEPADWFWHLMDNLELRSFNDARKFDPREVDHIVDRVIFRQYDEDGNGGLFPLRNPSTDQRNVELWYQLSAYVLELEHI